MMQDLHAITVSIFAHQEDCQFFSGQLCTPESSLRHAQKMKRKVPRRSAVVIMITQISQHMRCTHHVDMHPAGALCFCISPPCHFCN